MADGKDNSEKQRQVETTDYCAALQQTDFTDKRLIEIM
jgi:hypothetical protein